MKTYPQEFEVMLDYNKIINRINELGKQITLDYSGKQITLVGVLKGSFMFLAELVKHINLPIKVDFLRVSSYEGTTSTGVVRTELDMTQSVEGEEVILVEDIVDTGTTIECLCEMLNNKKPKSLKVATLLDKPGGRNGKNLNLNYIGFEIENLFVVGYGLDLDGQYRDFPDILVKKN